MLRLTIIFVLLCVVSCTSNETIIPYEFKPGRSSIKLRGVHFDKNDESFIISGYLEKISRHKVSNNHRGEILFKVISLKTNEVVNESTLNYHGGHFRAKQTKYIKHLIKIKPDNIRVEIYIC